MLIAFKIPNFFLKKAQTQISYVFDKTYYFSLLLQQIC